MNTQTPEPARPPEPSRRPRGASLSPDPASAAASPRDPAARRGARAAALALLALAALALAAADNAAAQTETTLVSNKGQLLTWRDLKKPQCHGVHHGRLHRRIQADERRLVRGHSSYQCDHPPGRDFRERCGQPTRNTSRHADQPRNDHSRLVQHLQRSGEHHAERRHDLLAVRQQRWSSHRHGP